MDPKQIQKNLDRQRELARSAAYKLSAAAVEQGYDRKIVERALGYELDALLGRRPAGGDKPAEKTVKRTGTITAGPNAGKKVIEYSDGTQEIK
jgi:hypothetical protein